MTFRYVGPATLSNGGDYRAEITVDLSEWQEESDAYWDGMEVQPPVLQRCWGGRAELAATELCGLPRSVTLTWPIELFALTLPDGRFAEVAITGWEGSSHSPVVSLQLAGLGPTPRLS